LDLLLKIKDVDAIACRGGPIFDTYSYHNEEYSLRSTTREPPLVGRFPPLKTTRNPTATPILFRAAF
jgi:hypothetical protein